MGIEAKHEYYFGYLRSEEWSTVRAAVLANHNSKCYLCGTQSYHHDVHHVEYPKPVWKTKPHHCMPLCRQCHSEIHLEMEAREMPHNWDTFRKLSKMIWKKRGIDRETLKLLKQELDYQI